MSAINRKCEILHKNKIGSFQWKKIWSILETIKITWNNIFTSKQPTKCWLFDTCPNVNVVLININKTQFSRLVITSNDGSFSKGTDRITWSQLCTLSYKDVEMIYCDLELVWMNFSNGWNSCCSCNIWCVLFHWFKQDWI